MGNVWPAGNGDQEDRICYGCIDRMTDGWLPECKNCPGCVNQAQGDVGGAKPLPMVHDLETALFTLTDVDKKIMGALGMR